MRNSWEADSFGLSGEDVFNWKKVMPTVNDHVQNYLINFFLDDLNLFWNEVKKVGNPKWRRLVESVFNLAFDRGLRQEISLSLPNGETRNAEPVYMLGRAAGIDWLKRKTGFKKDGDIFLRNRFKF